MTADTLKTTRVLELYQDFLSGKLINKQQAAEQYHVNVRSIQRDIDSIRDFLSEQCAKEGIVRKIEYDKKENGYRLVTQEIEQLSKGEVLALCKILLESRAFTKEQVEKQLQIILNLCVSQKEKSDIEWFISNELFHYHDPAHAAIDPDNLWMVAQAIRNQSVLEILRFPHGAARRCDTTRRPARCNSRSPGWRCPAAEVPPASPAARGTAGSWLGTDTPRSPAPSGYP